MISVGLENAEEEVLKAYCPDCMAVFSGGRWHWDAHRQRVFEKDGEKAKRCPACHMIKHDLPRGIISLMGIADKKLEDEVVEEVVVLIGNAHEKNPLENLIRVNKKSDEIVIFITSAELSKTIGRHIERKFGGSLSIDSQEGDELSRVVWISKKH